MLIKKQLFKHNLKNSIKNYPLNRTQIQQYTSNRTRTSLMLDVAVASAKLLEEHKIHTIKQSDAFKYSLLQIYAKFKIYKYR